MSVLRSKSIVGRQSSMKNYARLAAWALASLIFGSVSVHAQNITTVVGGGPVGLTPTSGSVGSPVWEATPRRAATPVMAVLLLMLR